MNINLTTKKPNQIHQKFTFLTKELWENNKSNYTKSLLHNFEGNSGQICVLFSDQTVEYLIGLGSDPKGFEIQDSAAKFSYDYRKNIQPVSTVINVENFNEEEISRLLKGLYLGTYEYPFKAMHPVLDSKFLLYLQNQSSTFLEKMKSDILGICSGQFACMEWLNKPQNFKRVPAISAFLKEISKKYKFKYTVFDREKSTELGLGAFLAVNQGSSQEAAFTILEYQSGVKSAKTIGLVGKCVLFDTGGISIKPSANLHYMKSDMGGATAVIGTLIAAAEMKLPVNIIAVLPITDNAVSNAACIPSDVITAYNGKTIEIIDTDAEGRLTLADGLSYLSKNYKTDAMIDLATLTGSSVRMFGDTCAAYFSNNEKLSKSLEDSSIKTNQRIWNLPLWEVWKDEFTSDVADFKNISSKPYGDCIVAAKFLEQFTEDHPSWAHLDIAGVAFGNVPYMKEKGATGYGVQLLTDFLENFS